MLLSHQPALSALDGEIGREEALSRDPVIRAIERQRPLRVAAVILEWLATEPHADRAAASPASPLPGTDRLRRGLSGSNR